MSFSKRINRLISEHYSSQRSFSRKMGVNSKTINNIVNESNSPNYLVVEKILNTIPNLSAEWLTRGEGPMWKEGTEPEAQKPTTTKESNKWDDLTLKEFIELIQARKDVLKG